MIGMSEDKMIDKMLSGLNENELAVLVSKIGLRMLVLKVNSPDAAFWFSVFVRLQKWMNGAPDLNEKEKDLILNPPEGTKGRIRAIRAFRDRTGMRLKAAMEVIDKWMKDNNVEGSNVQAV